MRYAHPTNDEIANFAAKELIVSIGLTILRMLLVSNTHLSSEITRITHRQLLAVEVQLSAPKGHEQQV